MSNSLDSTHINLHIELAVKDINLGLNRLERVVELLQEKGKVSDVEYIRDRISLIGDCVVGIDYHYVTDD